MAIKVTGTTDTTGAVSVFPAETKPVIIVAEAGTEPSESANKIFDIFGTNDAITKFGVGSKAIKLVELLIRNSVASIKGVVVGEEGTTDAEKYEKAFDSLLMFRQTNHAIIIMDTTESTIITKLQDHLDMSEAEDLFRYACVGGAETIDSIVDWGALAEGINHSRIFVPGGVHSLDVEGEKLDGIFLAAGLAALIATETDDPALPMNGVEMRGFGGLERELLTGEKEALVNAGIVPMSLSPSGRPTVYRLVTTYTKDTSGEKDIIWQEGTTRFIADDVLFSNIRRIRTNYKRTKNVVRILDAIRSDVVDELEKKEGLEIIEDFDVTTVIVRKDPEDLYGALIEYDFDVVTPLYTIKIKQNMKL